MHPKIEKFVNTIRFVTSSFWHQHIFNMLFRVFRQAQKPLTKSTTSSELRYIRNPQLSPIRFTDYYWRTVVTMGMAAFSLSSLSGML